MNLCIKRSPFILSMLLLSLTAFAIENSIEFEQHIVPIFQENCVSCHNEINAMANLNLENAHATAHGGLHGNIIVKEHPNDSLLWQKIFHDEMPPEEPLTNQEKKMIQQWITQGANGLPDHLRTDSKEHWAFQSPQMPNLPIANSTESVSVIDRIIDLKLAIQNITMNPEADKLTLIRRVSFNLTGLPPTPKEISMYITDHNTGAYERMVERYLRSPRYGEHWAQYWLDAVGYADSNGYFHADTDRPLAYKYRDYVIRSFNENKPYNQFIMEQIAGDELVEYTIGDDITPEILDPLIATHFLRNAQDGTGESDGNIVERQTDRIVVLEGTVDIVTSSLLGMTFRCAKCHDHKFDPISQEDYYSMQSVFVPAFAADTELWLKPNERVVEIVTKKERKQYKDKLAWIQRQVKPLQDSKDAFIQSAKQQVVQQRLLTLSDEIRMPLQEALETLKSERNEEQNKLIETHQSITMVQKKDLEQEIESYVDVTNSLDHKMHEFENQKPHPLEKISILYNVNSSPLEHQVFIRGDHTNRGKTVEPNVPQSLSLHQNTYSLPHDDPSKPDGRRTALAQWITSSDNPLTARVMINRIWQHLFQRGIVTTQANFGRSGASPSHQELLDYLAIVLMKSDWDIKNILREILYSNAFRQSSDMNQDAYRIDPANTLLWRYPTKRLPAESIRDAMLFVSGELDQQMYGPYIPVQRDDDKQVIAAENHPGRLRRSIYLQKRRTEMPSMLELFDSPSMVTSVQTRSSSTVALQSLFLLNSRFVIERAEAFANRIESESPIDDEDRVSIAFLIAVGRSPNANEVSASMAFMQQQNHIYSGKKNADNFALRDLCQMLFASNAFLYIQ